MTRRVRSLIAASVTIAAIGLFAVLGEDAQREIAFVLVPGLSAGAIYALVALGLALVYKATKVFNFAQGEFGTVPIFVVWLFITRGIDPASQAIQDATTGQILLGMGLGLLVGVLLALLVYVLVVRPLQGASGVTTLVGTAGVALFIVSVEIILGEASVRSFPELISGTPCLGSEVVEGAERCTTFFNIGGVLVDWNTILIFAVLAIVSFLLGLFFRTQTGTALLATSQDPFAASLYGVSTNTMSMITWGTAGFLGALGGLLAVGFSDTFTPGLITGQYLVAGFTAAILGGITSMPGAVLGGILVGLVQSASQNFLPDSMSGKAQVGVFAVLLLVLLIRPRGLLGKEA